MEVIFNKLILNEYTDEYINANCSLKRLKNSKDLLGVEEEYADDFNVNNLSFGVIDKETNEYFSLFFLSSETHENGNIKYTINKIIVDEKLSEASICHCCRQVLSMLNDEEHLIKYAIVADDTHFYSCATKQIAVEQVVNEVDKRVKLKRHGMGAFPDILQGIADNFHKHK